VMDLRPYIGISAKKLVTFLLLFIVFVVGEHPQDPDTLVLVQGKLH